MGEGLVAEFSRTFARGPTVRAKLRAAAGRVVVLLGSSGCGKTTILRCIAGLDQPTGGRITMDGAAWDDAERGEHLRTSSRGVGLVFQEPLVFPHLSVMGNVMFGVRGSEREDGCRAAMALIERLGLGGMGDQGAAELSGGQKQRAALARALAAQPRLLLLDEPLSALDGPARDALRGELRGVLRSAGVPVVLVTHDRTEALALADELAVMADHEVRQQGAIEDVYARPADAGVAAALGVETILPGVIEETSEGLARVRVGAGAISALNAEGLSGNVLVCIRAADVILQRAGSAGADSARNHLSGTVTEVRPEDPLMRVRVECGVGRPVDALITRQSAREMGLAAGVVVVVVVKAPCVHLVGR